jgi:hypothetical protein
MFQSACALYRECLCSFGAGGPKQKPRIFSYSCLVSPKHVLTCRHVVAGLSERFPWLVTFRRDGIFRCEEIFDDVQTDVAVLGIGQQLSASESAPCSSFPLLSQQPIGQGMTVGYLTRLWKKDFAGEQGVYTYFSSAHTSYRYDTEHGTSVWVLSGGLIESGFSGSPVFLPDGSLIGKIVGASCMMAGTEGLPEVPCYFPQISGNSSIPREVLQAIADAR